MNALSVAAIIVSAVVVAVLVVVLVVGWLPTRLVPKWTDLGAVASEPPLTPFQHFTLRENHRKARNDLRVGLLQGIAGVALIGTLVIAVLQFQSSRADFA